MSRSYGMIKGVRMHFQTLLHDPKLTYAYTLSSHKSDDMATVKIGILWTECELAAARPYNLSRDLLYITCRDLRPGCSVSSSTPRLLSSRPRIAPGDLIGVLCRSVHALLLVLRKTANSSKTHFPSFCPACNYKASEQISISKRLRAPMRRLSFLIWQIKKGNEIHQNPF